MKKQNAYIVYRVLAGIARWLAHVWETFLGLNSEEQVEVTIKAFRDRK